MQKINWLDYAPGEYRIECPSCGRGGKDKTAGLTVEPNGGVLHCFRCAFVESYKPERGAVMRTPTITPERKTQQKYERLSDWGRSLWALCEPIKGVAAQYLKHRKCVIPPSGGDLRWHPNLKHPSGYIGAGLVGLITDSLTGEARSLHRTWIQADGTKANVEPPRLLLGNHSLKNACIRLWPDEYVSTGLGIGEGIETCLSLAHAFEPVWSVLDAGHLSSFPVLAGVECLVIAQDQDSAGIKAANECAARWHKSGRKVRVTNQQTNDVNDLMKVAA